MNNKHEQRISGFAVSPSYCRKVLGMFSTDTFSTLVLVGSAQVPTASRKYSKCHTLILTKALTFFWLLGSGELTASSKDKLQTVHSVLVWLWILFLAACTVWSDSLLLLG